MTDKLARYGWGSRFPEFSEETPLRIREKLCTFILDASREQISAWDQSIRPLQAEVREILNKIEASKHYSTILEYESKWGRTTVNARQLRMYAKKRTVLEA